jgi:DNA-directed RNA polymerase specialized sigma24 family protein
MKELRTYEFNNQMLTIPEIVKETGIARSTIHQRLLRGERGELLSRKVDRRAAAKMALHSRWKGADKNKFVLEIAMSYKEIAQELGLKEKHVYLIERRALIKIRKALRLKVKNGYYNK